MTDYRVYYVGTDGHFCGAEQIEAADDAGAFRQAAALAAEAPVQIWQRDRCVGVLPRLAHPSAQPLT